MHDSMLKKLDQLQNRINEIQDLLLDSKTIEDIDKITFFWQLYNEFKKQGHDDMAEILRNL